jgi:hypothetical protein
VAMSDYGRVSRLRALIAGVERVAPSEERAAVLVRVRNRLSALELVWQKPSAWPAHGQGLSFPPPRHRVGPQYLELADLALD